MYHNILAKGLHIMFLPVVWNFRRESIYPVLVCHGIANSENGVRILLDMSVNYIEEAIKYKGVAFREDTATVEGGVNVCIFLAFPDEEKFQNFTTVLVLSV